jgi:hypothetical protein
MSRPSASSCLTEEIVLDFLIGVANPTTIRDVNLHIDACARCRQWLAELARGRPTD